MTSAVLLGVDVGTTDVKVLATTLAGREVAVLTAPTVWTNHGGRFTDTPASIVADTALDLLAEAASQAAQRLGPVRVAGIGVTGMGEAGVLLDRHSEPLFPVLAWFDPRGADEIRRLSPAVREAFGGRTGLPLSPMATAAKLGWMHNQGIELGGHTWLNVAEYLVFRLGGEPATELSLLSRTGLQDQDTGEVWPEMLAEISAPASLIPPRVLAGTPLGRVSGRRGPVPAELDGAVLTVAGHDHPVAAVGCGVLGADELFDSFGTAEALVATVSGTLDFAARQRLAGQGIDAVHHVLAGRRALLGGTKAGLVLRRMLRLLGADEPDARERLDEATMSVDGRDDDVAPAVPGLEIGGAANNDGVLRITAASDDISPAGLWRASLAHAVEEATRCLRLMEAEIGRVGATVVAGGWTNMRSVRAAKPRSLPSVRFSPRKQAGAFGARLFAAHAVATADRMAVCGDRSAVALDHPSGPALAFAARFGGHPTQLTETSRCIELQETPV